jgi:hypothetical protein
MSWFARRREQNSDWVDVGIRLALIIAAVAPFAHTLFYGFVYDDSVILMRNPVIMGWHAIIEVWKHPYWSMGGPSAAGLYRPVLMLFFAIIWNGVSRFPIAFHFFALAMHATATLLVASLLRRAFGRWPSAAAALWFALHPVHVEAIASVANVSEILVAIWTLLLAQLLLTSGKSQDSELRPPSVGRALVAALIYAMALLTKESGAVAPALALIVAIGWRRTGPPQIGAVLARVRGWAMLIGLWAAVLVGVVIVRRIATGALAGAGSLGVPGLSELSGPQRIIAMLSTGGHVARLLFWPSMQSPDYGPSELAVGLSRVLAAAATALTLLVALIWSGRRAFRSNDADARPLVAVVWCLIAYFPASNLVAATGPILAERTLYVASIGVAMLVAWSLEQLGVYVVARRAIGARQSSPWKARVPMLVVGVIYLAICARGYVRAEAYSRVWRLRHSLFTRIVEVDSLNYRGYQLLAIEANDQHEPTRAADLYRRAYSLRPTDPLVIADYGEFLLETGDSRSALTMGERLMQTPAMRTDARAVTLYLNATGPVWGVDSVLAFAQRLNTTSPSARAALFIGMAYAAKRDTAAARAAYRAGLERFPRDSALIALSTSTGTD